jgi:hypothetical protein
LKEARRKREWTNKGGKKEVVVEGFGMGGFRVEI